MQARDFVRTMCDQMSTAETRRLNSQGECDHGGGRAILRSAADFAWDEVPPSQFFSLYEQFMPEFENTMNYVLTGTMPEGKAHLMEDPFVLNQIITRKLRENCKCIPVVTEEAVSKLLSGCFVMLGVDYVLQSREHTEKVYKDGFAKRANIMAVATLLWEGMHSRSSVERAKKWRSVDIDQATQFLAERSGCGCLTKAQCTGANAACVNCKQHKEKLLRCNGCKSVMYCGKKCQATHWSKHKGWCKKNRK